MEEAVISVSPGRIKVRRNSTGTTIIKSPLSFSNSEQKLLPPYRTKLEDAVQRRNSTGMTIIRSSLSSSNSEQKLLPRYLRASTSSCHDFCKYGRKHAFEENLKGPVTRKVVRKGTTPEGQSKVKDTNVRERKKTPVIKLKAISEAKTELSDRPPVTKKKAPPFTKKMEVSAKPAVILKPRPNPKTKPMAAMMSSPSSFPRVGPGTRRNSELTLPCSAGGCNEKKPFHSLRGLSSRRGSDSRTVKNTKSPKILQKKELKPPTASLSPKPSVKVLASLKSLKRGDPNLVSTANNHDKLQRSQCRDDTEETVYAIEPELDKSSLEPVEHESYSPQSSSPPSLMSLSLPSFSSSTSLSSEGEAADTKEEDKDEKEEVEEGEEEVEYDDEGEEEYDSLLDEADYSDSEQDGTKKGHGEILKGNQGRRRSPIVHPADKDCSPQKLKFRRGKVINPESVDNCPRRLRFRRGRVVSDAPNGKLEVGKRSFRRRELGGGGDSSGTSAEARVVMLRHQGVQGKKEEQGLFNEVIEVTASKLAETRKSKVKALVGAFETVISLQDSKPANAV